MASNPSPAKRARTDAPPAYSRSQLHPQSPSQPSRARPVQNGGPRPVVPTSPVQLQNKPVQDVQANAQARTRQRRQYQPRRAAHATSATSQPQPRPSAEHDPLASVPPGWGPMGIPESMTMSLHETLEILDPTSSTPHDLYVVLVYAAASHSDIGQMLDRLARAEKEARSKRRAREDAKRAAGGWFEPIEQTAEDELRELVEREKQERAEARAARQAARAAKEARMVERRRQKIASSVVKPGMDKDFAYLVRKAEEELGWTGKWDAERQSIYSRAALRKESYWYNRAVDVRESLRWMQNQLIKEIRLVGSTFGSRRNALFAMMQILHAVVVDDRSGVGKNLREHWFSALEEKFKEAMALTSDGDLAQLRTENQEKWTRDLKTLIRLVRDKELPDTILKEILLMVDPTSGDPARSEDDSSEHSGEASQGESGDSDEESETSSEASSESEADSESGEDSG